MQNYEDFKIAMETVIDQDLVLKITMTSTGACYVNYMELMEIYEEDESCVLNFKDDSTLVLTPGKMSVQNDDDMFDFEGEDLLINIEIM